MDGAKERGHIIPECDVPTAEWPSHCKAPWNAFDDTKLACLRN
jgi:hypothetical protein